jgi:hypothetical protein
MHSYLQNNDLAVPAKRVISIASPATAKLVNEPFFPSPTIAKLPVLFALVMTPPPWSA